MKFYLKSFFILFEIAFILRVVGNFFQPIVLCYQYDCLMVKPFVFFILFLGLILMNTIWKGKLDFFIRLFLIYYFVFLSVMIFFDIKPNEYLDDAYVQNMLEKTYNRTLTFWTVVGVIFSGYFFGKYKWMMSDFIHYTIGVFIYCIFFFWN